MTTPSTPTRVYRDRWGKLNAETRYALAGPFQLEISTGKSFDGKLVTDANVCKFGDGMKEQRFPGDFRARVYAEPTRCTEKALREQHSRALTLVDQLLERAREYYAAKGENLNAEVAA